MEGEINFDDIYSKHYEYVRNVCLRVIKDDAIAEDVTQEAFINVWRKLHTFNGTAAIRTWIHRIAVNQSLMYLRRQPLIERLQLDDAVVQILPACFSHPRHRLALNRAIGGLPRGYKQIFVLREVLGYSHPEIAKMLDCTESTSKSQNWKAKQQLRKSVELVSASS